MKIYYESSLYHHGILGQKWGKKNGPPYPLETSQLSTAEIEGGGGGGAVDDDDDEEDKDKDKENTVQKQFNNVLKEAAKTTIDSITDAMVSAAKKVAESVANNPISQRIRQEKAKKQLNEMLYAYKEEAAKGSATTGKTIVIEKNSQGEYYWHYENE